MVAKKKSTKTQAFFLNSMDIALLLNVLLAIWVVFVSFV